MARAILRQHPDDARLAVLLWAMLDADRPEVTTLAWEVLERNSWDEHRDPASFASLILQLRISPMVSDDDRRRVFAVLMPLAQTPRQQANLATLAIRQWCLGTLPPDCTACLAQQVLVEPEFYEVGVEIHSDGSEFPAGIGNLQPWRLFLLAGRASVPALAEDLFHESREIRVGAQWCLERILLIRLKDSNYSVDSSLEDLRRLRDQGLVQEMKAMAR